VLFSLPPNSILRSDLYTNAILSVSNNKLIGVSLKKTGNEAKLGVYNLSDEDKKGYTYEGSDSRPTNNNTVVVYSDGSITFRTFKFFQSFNILN
jgi:hypothetical protein